MEKNANLLLQWEPIAKDNREFSLNEFEEYETRLPNIIVKAGAYSMNDQNK